ncbi:M6 family metalloprotease domain-containing protein [uncultured Desulfuromonas sp.]|uniref:M6 family metalloprotease domain-containing protein n=1 Tax=uncultured Desulfuromonas sp. TaxID=181013 RepID=UPI002618AA2C|nr:M6 family metalloprotease domain-containing protein [uncultured Desulfuromonas sp.]
MLARLLVGTILGVFIGCSFAWAAPVAPIEVTLTQADGSTFKARPRGDEYASWTETLDGYTIVRKDKRDWHYAAKDAEGKLVAGPHKVYIPSAPGRPAVDPRGSLTKHLRPPVDESRFQKRVPRKLKSPKSLKGGGRSSGASPAESQGAPAFSPGAELSPSPAPLASSPEAPQGAPATPAVVDQPVLTILVSFTDISFDYSDASFQDLMYGASGSVKDYFLENSYDNFTVVPASESQGTLNDGIVAVTLGYAHPNPGQTFSSCQAIAADAILAADSSIDYSAYDTDESGAVSVAELSIVIILAGYENAYGGASAQTPRVWGHQYVTASPVVLDGVSLQPYAMFGERHFRTGEDEAHQATIGIMAHELGHLMLSLPDLYDRDGGSEGIGGWGLMAAGSWNTDSANAPPYSGDSPAHLCAYSKVVTEMVVPDDIATTALDQTVLPASTAASVKRLWIDRYRIGEHFLVANRNQAGFDAGLPGEGLMVWHIDPSVSTQNDDETHKLVDLESADGQIHLDAEDNSGDAGDPFPGTSANLTFDDDSTPNARDYSGSVTGISVESIDDAAAPNISADFHPAALSLGDWLGYDDGGLSSATGYAGSIWTAILFSNDTGMDTLDGFEVYAWEAGATSVDFYLYDSIAGGSLGLLKHTQTGFVAQQGWNRFLLSTPFDLGTLPGSDFVMVLEISGPSGNGWASLEPSGTSSGRSYKSWSNAVAFQSLSEDLLQHVLLSSTSLPNESPTAVDDSDSVYQNASVTIDILANDSDPDGSLDQSSVAETQPSHGSVVDNGDGTVRYTAAGCYSGPDSFTYTVDDDQGATSNAATVSITVNAYPPVLVIGGHSSYYSDIASAYAGASSFSIIKLKDQVFTEDLVFDQDKSLTFQGGYSCDFGDNPSETVIDGKLTVRDGRVKLEKIRIK